MKTIKESVASAAVVLGMLGLSVPWCGAAIPGGLLTYDVTDSANLLWDVTKVSDLHNIHVGIGDISADIYFDVDFTQDGAGKLKGAGVTTVEVISSELSGIFANATYKVTGKVSSRAGVAKLRYQATASVLAQVNSRQTRVKATAVWTATLNGVTKQLTGIYKNRASASGRGSASETGPIPQTWADVAADLGDGGWSIHLALSNDSFKKITGTAAVRLDSGAVLPFTVKGKYNSKTDMSKLVLIPAPGSKGSSLRVTMLGNNITELKGKVFGQFINYLAP
jgi:hypothetical protein